MDDVKLNDDLAEQSEDNNNENAGKDVFSVEELMASYKLECETQINAILLTEVNQKRFKLQEEYDKAKADLEAAQRLYEQYLEAEDIKNMITQAKKVDELEAACKNYSKIMTKYAPIPVYPDEDLIAIGLEVNEKIKNLFEMQRQKLESHLLELQMIIEELDYIISEQDLISSTIAYKSKGTDYYNMKSRVTGSGSLIQGDNDYLTLKDNLDTYIYKLKNE